MDTYLLGRRGTDERTIAMCGELAFPVAGELSRQLLALAEDMTGDILLDLSQVTFMDCAGWHVLIGFERHARSAGGNPRLGAVSPAVALLFELVGVPSHPAPVPLDPPPRR